MIGKKVLLPPSLSLMMLLVGMCQVVSAQKVNEKTWPDGTPKMRETLNRKGFRSGECTYWYENGQMRLREFYEAGRRSGTCEAWFEDGTPQYVRSYVVRGRGNGGLGIEAISVRDGRWTEYYYNGQPMKEEDYSNGVLQGVVRMWYEDGRLQEEKTMEDKFENGPYKHYYEDGSTSQLGQYEKGEKTGVWQTWYPNGQLAYRELYASDKHVDGPWTGKHANGADSLIGTYRNGLKEGIWVATYPNGQMKSKVLYRSGEPIGNFVEFHANGRKKTEGGFGTTWSDALRQREEGSWREWYDNGQQSIEATYDDGRLTGPYTEWYPNGQKHYETSYVISGRKSEMMDGMTREWYADGQLRSEGAYITGLRDGLWREYFEDGTLMSEAIYDRSKPSGAVTVYYPNGKTRFRGYYEVAGRKKKRTGHWVEYFDNGNEQSEGEYINNRKQGRWREWYEDGGIKEDAFFDNGMYQGAYKAYHPNGQLMTEGEYKGERSHQGLAHGPWKHYDENGVLLRTEYWYNGRQKE
jgi:antitoxin component YwqK of YwqJK toxin-antitoxin module